MGERSVGADSNLDETCSLTARSAVHKRGRRPRSRCARLVWFKLLNVTDALLTAFVVLVRQKWVGADLNCCETCSLRCA